MGLPTATAWAVDVMTVDTLEVWQTRSPFNARVVAKTVKPTSFMSTVERDANGVLLA
jgi:hypothetical protein